MPFIDALGQLSIIVALLVLARLSKRLGSQTQAKPYYRGFIVAALLMSISLVARVANGLWALAPPDALATSALWIILYSGLPALALTIGVVFAWRYWSWLLAERD